MLQSVLTALHACRDFLVGLVGLNASTAHWVSCTLDHLNAHPVRQEVHSAWEMTLIDCFLLTESEKGEGRWRKWAGENEVICTMGVSVCGC